MGDFDIKNVTFWKHFKLILGPPPDPKPEQEKTESGYVVWLIRNCISMPALCGSTGPLVGPPGCEAQVL